MLNLNNLRKCYVRIAYSNFNKFYVCIGKVKRTTTSEKEGRKKDENKKLLFFSGENPDGNCTDEIWEKLMFP